MNRELKRLAEYHTYADDQSRLGKGIFGKPSFKRKSVKSKSTPRMLKELTEHYTIDDTSKLGRGVFSKPISNDRHHPPEQCLHPPLHPRIGKRFQASIPKLSYDSIDRKEELC